VADPIEVNRRLVAVFAADVEGYSRLMGADEVATLKGLTGRRAILDKAIADHRGRIANTAGDSVLAEFGSAVDAVKCAVEAQAALAEANASIPSDKRINFRIGIHVGDVMVRAGDLFGDGVNIAARLQALAQAGGVCVSGETYGQVRKVLPIAFTDLGAQAVKNIEEPVKAYALTTSPPTSHFGSQAPKPLPLPDKPSIAVLPFQNMSDDPEQQYFADGMVEDIITELSRYKSLFVIARNSSFTYKGKAVDIKQIGRELGVRYVLEGSVRKAGGRVRITGQLVDSISGAHVWAEHFDREMADVFVLQDEITQSVVSAVEPNLRSAEIARTNNVPTENLSAYDLYLRARADLGSYSKDSAQGAEALLRRAIELDPHYSDAWALLADSLARQVAGGWLGREAVAEVHRAASMAIRTGPENGFAHSIAGAYLAIFGGSLDQAVNLVKRALVLHPNSDDVRAGAGWTFALNGDLETALEHLEAGLRMAPFGPRVGRILFGMTVAYFYQRKFDEAVDCSNKSFSELINGPNAWRYRTAALAHAGRIDDAHDALRHFLTLAPDASISAMRSNVRHQWMHEPNVRHQWMRELLIEGLRKAGHPE
jgi:adenylate cyclase